MQPFSAEERRALFSSISLETIDRRPDWLPNFYKSQAVLVRAAREKLTPCCECGQIGMHGGGCAQVL